MQSVPLESVPHAKAGRQTHISHSSPQTEKKKSFEHLGHFSTNAYPNYIQIERDPVALPTGLNQCLWQPEESFDEGTK